MKLTDKVFLFDVNHTLINTAMGHLHAMKSMEQTLLDEGVGKQKAHEIIKHVHYITSLMITGFLIRREEEWDTVPGGKQAYEELLFRINMLQKNIYQEWKFIKKWSREVFLKIAADYVGIRLDRETIKKVVDAHWRAITEHAKPFSSAKVLFKELKRRSIPVYILTSSDGRLVFKDGTFYYDPIYSEISKRKRMQFLKKEGLHFDGIIIGDPHDKPQKEFFEKGKETIAKDLGRKIEVEDFVMVGNSFEDDLEIPIKHLNFGLGILVEEGKKSSYIDRSILRVGNLQEVVDFLE